MDRRWMWGLAAALALASAPARAQNVSNGESLYHAICQSCHLLPPIGGAVLAANNPSLIRQAINGLVPTMQLAVGPLGLTDAQLADIAAYIGVLEHGPAPPPPPPPPPAAPIDYSDLWWNPDEQGWGLNLVEHASTNMFGVMYTYGPDGKPLWFVLPGGTWVSSNVFGGNWFQVEGPPYSGAFDPAAVHAVQVGTATLTFSDASHGTLAFSVNGTTVVKPIVRQPF